MTGATGYVGGRLPIALLERSSEVRLVTPLNARIGRKLIESLPHETVVRDPRALERFSIRPRGFREAVARTQGGQRGRLVDTRVRSVAAPPARAFAPGRRIGGANGWPLHKLVFRGMLDGIAQAG